MLLFVLLYNRYDSLDSLDIYIIVRNILSKM